MYKAHPCSVYLCVDVDTKNHNNWRWNREINEKEKYIKIK